MGDWYKVAKINDIPEDTGHVIELNDRQIALFSVDGSIHAIDNICPHAGAPLGGGGMEDGVVMCPWHGWEFDVTSGKCTNIEGTKVESFPVKVEGEDVFVEA